MLLLLSQVVIRVSVAVRAGPAIQAARPLPNCRAAGAAGVQAAQASAWYPISRSLYPLATGQPCPRVL